MKRFAIFAACFLAAPSAFAVEPLREGPVFEELLELDRLVFEVGRDRCELSVYDDILADDLEFYHDVAGLTKGKETFLNGVRNGLCAGGASTSRRELIPQTLIVHPLYDNGALYGAVQMGTHRFYQLENDKRRLTGTADFTHLWLKTGEGWRLKRVLSYHHKPVE